MYPINTRNLNFLRLAASPPDCLARRVLRGVDCALEIQFGACVIIRRGPFWFIPHSALVGSGWQHSLHSTIPPFHLEIERANPVGKRVH